MTYTGDGLNTEPPPRGLLLSPGLTVYQLEFRPLEEGPLFVVAEWVVDRVGRGRAYLHRPESPGLTRRINLAYADRQHLYASRDEAVRANLDRMIEVLGRLTEKVEHAAREIGV